jgi:predicted phosphohydrolase
MLIQYCSDLHLEFPENRQFLAGKPITPRAKILILAGDIMPFSELSAHNKFLDTASAAFDRIYWLPGNHEYYHTDANHRTGAFTENIRRNLHLINNTTVEEGDVRIIFSTLWTQISPRFEWDIERGLSDFQVVRFGSRTLRASDVNQMHADSIAFLKAELACPTTAKRTVVVTHHVPTLFRYPDVYRGSILNEAFAVELHQLIHESSISHWIFGHHHFNVADFRIGGTTLTTNQLGYVKNNEHRGFSPDRTFEA